MRTRYRALIIFLVLVVFCVGVMRSEGYKLDPLQAARASSQIGKDAQLYGQVEFSWGKIFLFTTPSTPKSILVTKVGPFWQRQGTMAGKLNNDPIQTLCWQRVISAYTHAATILALKSTDPKVAFVEAGQGAGRIRKEISLDAPVIFSWEQELELSEVNAVALSSAGKILYEFRYPRKQTTVTLDDLRWYPVRPY